MLRNNSGDFYPRSPCGERPTRTPDLTTIGQFLSTLSLRRATVMHALEFANFMLFLSTLSLRRATDYGQYYIHAPGISIHALLAESDVGTHAQQPTQQISIHALLAESDYRQTSGSCKDRHFYPRSPCGERRKPRRLKSRRMVFLSTLSLRRATTFSCF